MPRRHRGRRRSGDHRGGRSVRPPPRIRTGRMRYAALRGGRIVSVGDEHGDGGPLCHVLCAGGLLTFDGHSGMRVAMLARTDVLHRDGEERETLSLSLLF